MPYKPYVSAAIWNWQFFCKIHKVNFKNSWTNSIHSVQMYLDAEPKYGDENFHLAPFFFFLIDPSSVDNAHKERVNQSNTHVDSSWPAMWVSSNTVLMWLLKVKSTAEGTMRVFCSYWMRSSLSLKRPSTLTVPSKLQRYCIIWALHSRSEESWCVCWKGWLCGSYICLISSL